MDLYIFTLYTFKVSPTNYDCKDPLSVNMTCFDTTVQIHHNDQSSIVFIRNSAKVKSVKGAVSVGLLPCPDADNENKPPTCNPKNHTYEIFVQTVSCRYWNHPEWVKHGCRVS